MANYSISGPTTNPILLPHDPAWKTPEWTFAFALKSLDNTYTPGVFSTSLAGNATTTGVCFELYIGVIIIDILGHQFPIFDSRDGLWHYYATCFDATDLRCYTDGVLRTPQGFPQTGLGAMVWDELPLTIAAFNNTALRLAQIRIFDRKLNISEVNILATGSEVTSGLIIRWPLTEGMGNTLNDNVNSFDATTAGSINWSSSFPSVISDGSTGQVGISSPLVGLASPLMRGTIL